MASPPAAAQAEAAPAEAPAGQPAAPAVTKVRAKRGESGLPAHVRPVKNKDGEVTCYMARLRWLSAEATAKRYDFIPGTFVTPTAAAEAQAEAQARLTSAGPEAVWPDGLPGCHGPRQKRDAAYWAAEQAAREEAEAKKAAAKAAREAAEAARPKKPRCEKQQRTTVPLPADRNKVMNECTRAFLVDSPAVGAENALPAWAQLPLPTVPAPVPVAPGLEAI